jgi:hypothetical protein
VLKHVQEQYADDQKRKKWKAEAGPKKVRSLIATLKLREQSLQLYET